MAFYRPNKPFLTLQTESTESEAMQCSRKLMMMHVSHENKVDHVQSLMDDIFKAYYQAEMVKQVSRFSRHWKTQLQCMNKYWRKTAELIDRTKLIRTFREECVELGLPEDMYDVERVFKKLKNEWQGHMMVQLAENLIRTYAPQLVTENAVVGWNVEKQQLVFSYTVMNRDEWDDTDNDSYREECNC